MSLGWPTLPLSLDSPILAVPQSKISRPVFFGIFEKVFPPTRRRICRNLRLIRSYTDPQVVPRVRFEPRDYRIPLPRLVGQLDPRSPHRSTVCGTEHRPLSRTHPQLL